MVAPTKYVDRSIPRISLHDFENRIDEITKELVQAAETDGFFTIVNSGIKPEEVDEMFDNSARFFSLPEDVKSTVPFSHKNVGWEKAKQIRPSTGKADQKESYQMQYGQNMEGMWLDEESIPGFKNKCLEFMHKVHAVSAKLMTCFARGLGFPDDYFIKAHDITKPNCQTVLRLLHYFAVDRSVPAPEGYYRAGAHADWDFLTLLFQKSGQSGLEICPGREVFTAFGAGDTWTKVEPSEDEIVCNIGDALMSWSDDRFKSTFHRVKTPTEPDDYYGPRYSMAYFNQPCTDVTIQGPLKKYAGVTAEEFTRLAMNRNFAALRAKQAALAAEKGIASGPPVAVAASA
ncbi:putative leucoanthocyanidin dioxygenase [Phaeomoniella chlamydospora]|uniref:Putative leucoanthocyanidin dioxygenase n=1 Tax=Phaeomoniella chlamydospora TaxID=158046 RepID=A0A0G2GNJ8_PHACM|nr:putative leucoanthocyanidin dioxygenase [Phaeomoniella chlamydospora]